MNQPLPKEDGLQLIALFNAGRHAELEARARQLSVQYPASGFVWKVLGTALLVQGKDGLHALQKAVELLPQDVESWSNLGNVQRHRACSRMRPTATGVRSASGPTTWPATTTWASP